MSQIKNNKEKDLNALEKINKLHTKELFEKNLEIKKYIKENEYNKSKLIKLEEEFLILKTK